MKKVDRKLKRRYRRKKKKLFLILAVLLGFFLAVLIDRSVKPPLAGNPGVDLNHLCGFCLQSDLMENIFLVY